MYFWHPKRPKPDTQTGEPVADLDTAGYDINLLFRVCCAFTSPTQQHETHPEHKQPKPDFSPMLVDLLYMQM